jgi:epoxyqueuosine reductase
MPPALNWPALRPVHEFGELDRFREWIAAGRAGEMQYMDARDETGALKRASLRTTLPWARSVVVCAINYNTAQPYSTGADDPQRGWIARYAWGQEDYHDAVMARLRMVENQLRDAVSASSALQTRCYVDTGPLVERVYAKYAGIGWIGKNTCIINQKLGSWLFLGVILTSLELEPDLPAPDRCGTCTRCIDACPTDALVAPYQLDSNRCISYLTIEKRGVISEDLRPLMGHEVFGCDICQDVCPEPQSSGHRRRGISAAGRAGQSRAGMAGGISVEEFREKFRGSAVRRAKRGGLRRNAVIAMGNSGDQRFAPVLEKLKTDEDPVVAESAQWAAKRIT